MELKNEIYNEARIEYFNILKIDEFLTKSKNYLNVNIEDSSIQDIKDSLKFKDKKFILKFDLKKENDNNESVQIGEADKFIEYLKYKKFKEEFLKSGNPYYDELVIKNREFEKKFGEFNEEKFLENLYFLNEDLSESEKGKIKRQIFKNINSKDITYKFRNDHDDESFKNQKDED